MPKKQSIQVECVCGACGKTFHVPACDAKRGVGKYCSTPCYDAKRAVPLQERFLRYVPAPDENGCILWTGELSPTGYGQLSVTKNGRRLRRLAAHRLAWEFANGPIPDGLEVCHDCPGGDNPRCVNPAHLFLGTHAENMRDAGNKQQLPCGERHHFSKLTADLIRLVRQEHAAGLTLTEIALSHDLKVPNVHAIVHRRSWKHITD